MTKTQLSPNDGFTLVELLIVVLIISLLAAIAIPVFTGQRSRAKDSKAMSNARNAFAAAKAYRVDADGYANFSPPVLHEIEPSLEGVAVGGGITFHDIGDRVGIQAVAHMIVLCARSDSSRIFCIKDSTDGTYYSVMGSGSSGAWLPSWSSAEVADTEAPPADGGGDEEEPEVEAASAPSPFLDVNYEEHWDGERQRFVEVLTSQGHSPSNPPSHRKALTTHTAAWTFTCNQANAHLSGPQKAALCGAMQNPYKTYSSVANLDIKAAIDGTPELKDLAASEFISQAPSATCQPKGSVDDYWSCNWIPGSGWYVWWSENHA